MLGKNELIMPCRHHQSHHLYPPKYKSSGGGVDVVKLTWGKVANPFTIISPPIHPHGDVVYINYDRVEWIKGCYHV